MQLEPVAEANVRAGALNHAMATATPGEPGIEVLARAMMYAHWVLEPFRTAATADAMGDAPSARLQ